MTTKITFGIIVLNGEPFTRFCIRALYPHAHEIVIAEGACLGAKNVATPDGHSQDGTLKVLKQIKQNEDPENKITVVTAEDEGHKNGFWPGEKHEQCQAFANRASGNFLWQVDIDEFYLDKDILKIKEMLSNDEISCVSFKQIGFWGGFNYVVDSWYFNRHLKDIFRIFKWGEGYQYITHRPPTVIDNKGVDVRNGKWLRAIEMKKCGIYLYHYSFVLPKQVKEKAEYYKNAEWSKRKEADYWANEIFMNLAKPYNVFSITTTYSWLGRFKGEHPTAIISLINYIKTDKTIVKRKTDDIEVLLNKCSYKTGKVYLKLMEKPDFYLLNISKLIKSNIKKILNLSDIIKT